VSGGEHPCGGRMLSRRRFCVGVRQRFRDSPADLRCARGELADGRGEGRDAELEDSVWYGAYDIVGQGSGV
jgi:hypothetical protein